MKVPFYATSEISYKIKEQLEKCRPLSSEQNWLSKQKWVQNHFENIFQYYFPKSSLKNIPYERHYNPRFVYFLPHFEGQKHF